MCFWLKWKFHVWENNVSLYGQKVVNLLIAWNFDCRNFTFETITCHYWITELNHNLEDWFRNFTLQKIVWYFVVFYWLRWEFHVWNNNVLLRGQKVVNWNFANCMKFIIMNFTFVTITCHYCCVYNEGIIFSLMVKVQLCTFEKLGRSSWYVGHMARISDSYAHYKL